MSAIYEVKKFLSRKEWIRINRSKVKSKGRNPVPVRWVFNSKEEPSGIIRLKSINLVKGYIQVPGVDYIDSFSPVATYTPIRVLI